MTNQTQNLFIVEDNPENSMRLHQFLENRFGTVYNIFTYTNAVQALSKVDSNTSIVVLDYDYFGDEGNKIVNFIKNINDKTRVIILANNDDIETEIASYQNGADDFLIKQKGVKKKLNLRIFEIISYPADYIHMKYGVNQFFVYLLFLFVIVGVLVFLGMQTLY